MIARIVTTTALLLTLLSPAMATPIDQLPILPAAPHTPPTDWLIDGSGYKAGVYRAANGKDLVLANGLLERHFRLAPNAATIRFENRVNGQAIIRAVKPEARVEIDGQRYDIGGLSGQPDRAYLRPEELEQLKADPRAFAFVGFEIGEPAARMKWKRVRSHAPDSAWPPKGAYLRMDYQMPEAAAAKVLGDRLPKSAEGRTELIKDSFETLDPAWKLHTSPLHERSSFVNEGKIGEIYTPHFTSVYAERAVPEGTKLVETKINPGTDVASTWGPSLALVWQDRTIMLNYRIGKSQDGSWGNFMVWDGQKQNHFNHPSGPIKPDKPIWLRLRLDDQAVHCEASSDGDNWFTVRTVTSATKLLAPTVVRVGKLGPKGGSTDNVNAPGKLVRVNVLAFNAYGEFDANVISGRAEQIRQLTAVTVSVHYELYDGIPCMSKWITVHNDTKKQITVDRFTSEILATVERSSRLDPHLGVPFDEPNVHVETDYSFGGSSYLTSRRWSVHWVADPEYRSQVNYKKKTLCVLKVQPTFGPSQDVQPGGTFESFRAFILPYDTEERERKGLALRRMYRTIAPWVTENPLMMHLMVSDFASLKRGVDQCAEVGFEMVILSFGTNFNIDNDSPAYRAKMKQYADYAKSKGVEIGGYSLLASRRVGGGNAVVSPPGEKPRFGHAPALASKWGQDYFRNLYDFYETTGFMNFEHDGSYPGDRDSKARPPLQKGADDSQWVQWRIITDFYKWCRGKGIHLNVPDTYFLSGSSKCMFDYYDSNWSLPRDQQVFHMRQNIYDGTWMKTPSMGWMFIPLTPYSGPPSSIVEPLDKNLAHYERMITSSLGLGTQACYRGTRLYDTARTKAMVSKWVTWFKTYRDILESDMIHGRRADGHDLDWMLHVNPTLKQKGMLVVFNPLKEPVEKTIRVNLYYAGLTETANIRREEGPSKPYKLTRDYHVDLPVSVPANGMTWYVIE